MSSSHLAIMSHHDFSCSSKSINADGLDFDRKCVCLLGCTGRRCICCNNAPEILKCYDTQAACMAHCTNPTI
uniref:Pollen coat protein B29 n=1 Tax=Brassica oleracea TaxID=3712 RepID=A0A4Y6I1J9_BRAOL|nr:pollen coat protein B29 [Brassica oleracea]